METTPQPSRFVHFLQTVRRSRSPRKLGGVCTGLAAYSDIPTWFFRATFVTFSILYIGVFAYIALWLFMPIEEEVPFTPENDGHGVQA